jgi:hypothetical protein
LSEVKASELWAALVEQPQPHRIVDFPRLDPVTGEPIGKLAIRVLTGIELAASTAEADKFAKKLLKDSQRKDEENKGYDDIYTNAASVELLYRACRDPKNLDRPAFPTPDDMRKRLTMDEIATLVNAYLQVQSEMGPIISHMTEDEMDAWVRRITEAGESIAPLFLLSSEMKNDLLKHLAFLLYGYRTASSSSGSQPVAPPKNDV